jgi:hypothetical protein
MAVNAGLLNGGGGPLQWIDSSEMIFLRSGAGYRKIDKQITGIRQELNIRGKVSKLVTNGSNRFSMCITMQQHSTAS